LIYYLVLILSFLSFSPSLVRAQEPNLKTQNSPLNAEEILLKTISSYQGLSSFYAKGTIFRRMNIKGETSRTSKIFELKLGRPEFYLISWISPNGSKVVFWNSGQGNFLYLSSLRSYFRLNQLKDVLSTIQGMSGIYLPRIPGLFFQSNRKVSLAEDFKFQGEEEINGEMCFVFSGETPRGKESLWISQGLYLIKKAENVYNQKLVEKSFKILKDFSPEAYQVTEIYIRLRADLLFGPNDFAFKIPPGVTLKQSVVEELRKKINELGLE